MSLTIVRWALLIPTPWKNGGGTAVDIAWQSEPGSAEGFGWRLNIATIDRSGPFSDFRGIDRDFRLLDGGDLELAVEGEEPRLLKPGGPPFRFPGDRPTFARLLNEEEPCRAFNVLTRRGGFESQLIEQVVDAAVDLRPEGGTLVGVVRAGELVIGSERNPVRLGTLDAFVVSERVTAHSAGEASLLLVHLNRA